uniref:Uncharacterized protein n=1 Tax=Manihot esculenta TaxID=3983 RepID=A0A2C9W028_MANES
MLYFSLSVLQNSFRCTGFFFIIGKLESSSRESISGCCGQSQMVGQDATVLFLPSQPPLFFFFSNFLK